MMPADGTKGGSVIPAISRTERARPAQDTGLITGDVKTAGVECAKGHALLDGRRSNGITVCLNGSVAAQGEVVRIMGGVGQVFGAPGILEPPWPHEVAPRGSPLVPQPINYTD